MLFLRFDEQVFVSDELEDLRVWLDFMVGTYERAGMFDDPKKDITAIRYMLRMFDKYRVPVIHRCRITRVDENGEASKEMMSVSITTVKP